MQGEIRAVIALPFAITDAQMAALHRLGSDPDALSLVQELTRRLAAAEAKIDALMLEFCPDEMSNEQKARWARNQRPVDDDILRATDSAPAVEPCSHGKRQPNCPNCQAEIAALGAPVRHPQETMRGSTGLAASGQQTARSADVALPPVTHPQSKPERIPTSTVAEVQK